MNIMFSKIVVCPVQVPFFACARFVWILCVNIHCWLSFFWSTYRCWHNIQCQHISMCHLGNQISSFYQFVNSNIHAHLKLPLKFRMEVRVQYGRREFSMSITELDKLFRSFLRVECLCHWHSSNSTCSLKKLVVRVYRMGFKALLIGRMKITTQDVMVP